MRPLGQIAAVWGALRRAFSTAVADEVQRRALPGVLFGSGVLIRGAERITTGARVFIDHRAYLNCGTLNKRRGYIRLGDRVEIGPYSVLWGGGGIEIGNNVHLGAHVHITSHQGRQVPAGQRNGELPFSIECAPVRIGDDVLIYSGAIVVPGVTIGDHAVVGAGAVVVSDIPPYATAVGVPARVVKQTAVTAKT
jgi:acetyltransferase-like isoleucine patch superfamily enzyme